MKYPHEIIPKESYKLSMDIDAIINDIGNITFSRRIDKDKRQCDTYDGKIMIEAQDITEHVVNMSLNIHGGQFTEKHIPFRQIRPGTTPWNGEAVKLEDYNDCFEKKDICFPIYLGSNDIHNKTIPYYRQICKEKEYNDLSRKINRVLGIFNGDREYKMISTIKVHHVPTMMNYWHGELKVYPEDNPDVPLNNKKSVWRRNLFQSISEDIILEKYITEQPSVKIIKELFYKK